MNMNVKATDCNPFYIHSQRKLELMKTKVEDSANNFWNIASGRDFPPQSMNNSRKAHNFLSRKDEQVYLSQNHCREIFHEKLIRYRDRVIKKKSISEINTIPNDFSYFNSTHPLQETKQNPRQFPLFRKKNGTVHFNIKDIQTIFPNKKSNVCLKSSSQTSSDFQNAFNMKQEKRKVLKKLSKENLLMNNSVISLVREFSSELNQAVSGDAISSNNCGDKNNETSKAKTRAFPSIEETRAESCMSEIRCDENIIDYFSEERNPCEKISSDFHSTYSTKPEKFKTFKKLSKENLSINNSIISLVRAFSSDFNQAVSNNIVILNNCSDKNNEISKINKLSFPSTEETQAESCTVQIHSDEKQIENLPGERKPCKRNSSDFQSTFVTKPKKCKILKKLSKENLSINNSVISLVRAFSSEQNQAVFSDAISLDNSSAIDNEIFETNRIDFPSIEEITESRKFYEERKPSFEIHRMLFSNENSYSSENDRGSNWMQSLYWTTDERMPGKMKLPNILPDGFANQMLKLQRREKSEKALQNHKINVKKKSIRNDSMSVILISLLHVEGIAVTLCYSSNTISTDTVNGETKACDNGFLEIRENTQPKYDSYYLVLFQESQFRKQHLKPGNCYLLLQPWHYIDLNSLQYPVILCSYFESVTARVNSSMTDGFQSKCLTNLATDCGNSADLILRNEICRSVDMLYFKLEKCLCLTARVQRIWNWKTSRFSFLLQTKDGVFHILKISTLNMHPNWQKCIQRGEGKCFLYENLKVAQRLDMKRCSHLFKFLAEILKQNTNNRLGQDFIYQLVPNNTSSPPLEVKETGFPASLATNMQPLAFIQKSSCQSERFSCCAKILFQFKDMIYVTDDSIFNSSTIGYVKVLLPKEEQFSKGSVVKIKEAVLQEDTLLLDEYGQFTVLHQSDQESFNLLNMKIPLKFDSSVADLAVIKGEVINVDESEACTWLQCNFCLQENLIEDINHVIYCEDCSSILKKPILNVKMNVTISTPELPNTLLNVQLLTKTIKQILQIGEDNFQPQCSVKDVLGSQIDSLFCYVRGFEMKEQQKVFYLSEMDPT